MTGKIHVFILTNTKWRETVDILKSYNLPYKVRHMKRDPFSYEEFKNLMKLTTDGFDDILTTKGNMLEDLKKHGIQFEALPMREAYKLILQHPNLLTLPLVTDFETRTGSGMSGARLFRPRQEKKKTIVEITVRAKDLTPVRKEGGTLVSQD
jgi:arsenate reductase-like glutaredoxin family protein